MHNFKVLATTVLVLLAICIQLTFAQYPQTLPPPPPDPGYISPAESNSEYCNTYCTTPGIHINQGGTGYFYTGEHNVWDGKSSSSDCKCMCDNGYHRDDAPDQLHGACVENIKSNQNNPAQACEDRPAEHLVADPNYTPPNCVWDCDSANGYHMNEGVCVCEDGYGTDAGACAKCTDLCAKYNKIPSPKSVGGVCDCMCDIANGYHIDDKTGECVSDIDVKLIDALNAKNAPNKMLDALVPYLQSNNQRTRILAAVGMISTWRTKGNKITDIDYDTQFIHYWFTHPDDQQSIKGIISSPNFPQNPHRVAQ